MKKTPSGGGKKKAAPKPAYTRAGVSQGLGPAPRKPPKKSAPSPLTRAVDYAVNYDPRRKGRKK